MIAVGRRLAAFRCTYAARSSIVYTRELLRQIHQDKAQLQQKKQLTMRETLQNELSKLPFNDNNPQNYVKVKLNHPQLFGDKPHLQPIAKPFIIVPEPRKPRKMISANKKYIKTSLKKMMEALCRIKRMHVVDAILNLMGSQKKVAKKLIPTFFNLLDHAKKRGFVPYRMFVHGLILGKTQRYRGRRYHAKGRGNPEKTDICQVKVILHEMPKEEFFMKIANGETPRGLAQDIKEILIKKNSSFEEIRKFRHMLTPRGRQQLKMLNRRRVDKMYQQHIANGTFQPKKLLLKQLLLQNMDKYQQLIETLTQSDSTLKLRQALFKKNNA